MVGGERTRRALLAAIGGVGLAGLAEYISDPTGELEFDFGSAPDGPPEEEPQTPVQTTSPTTPEAVTTVSTESGPPRGSAVGQSTGECRTALKTGFERPFDGRFRASGAKVARTTEYAATGEYGLVLRAGIQEAHEAALRTVDRFCAGMEAGVSARFITEGGGGMNYSLAVADPNPDSFAKLTFGPGTGKAGNEVVLQEWKEGGEVTGWSDVATTVGQDWERLELSITEDGVTGTAAGSTVSYDTTLDWATREKVLELSASTLSGGPVIRVAFDDLAATTA